MMRLAEITPLCLIGTCLLSSRIASSFSIVSPLVSSSVNKPPRTALLYQRENGRDRDIVVTKPSSDSADPMMPFEDDIPSRTESNGDDQRYDVVTGEVIGAAGRMGSFWLQTSPNVVPVPRGLAPGSLSQKTGVPIYVNIHSGSWKDVYQQTSPERRNDLVWIGNGLLADDSTFEQQDSTVVIPHYAMLQVYGKLYTSEKSPPTYVYGKHAKLVQKELEQHGGVQTEIVTSWTEMKVKAARKIFWASCMWLFCHYDKQSEPLTVKEVHEQYTPQLEKLVQELAPAFHELTSSVTPDADNSAFVKDTLQYLEDYSLSIPDAVVKLECAIDEIPTRNGVFSSQRNKHPQPFHEELIAKVAGSKTLERSIATANTSHDDSTVMSGGRYTIELPLESNNKMSVVCSASTGNNNNVNDDNKKVVVIGDGIVGTSIALNLARRGIKNVVVLDDHATNNGETARASSSRAWINANNKSSASYQWFNQVGMQFWKQDPILRDLPNWDGSLVGYQSKLPPHLSPNAGYPVEGPLSPHRISELQTITKFEDPNHVYHFPSEGHVDHSVAIQSLREEAKRMGVQFISNEEIEDITYHDDHQQEISGVCTKSTITKEITHISADVVVVTTSSGLQKKNHVHRIPILKQSPLVSTTSPSPATVSHVVVVDNVSKSNYVLVGQDDTLEAGGDEYDSFSTSTTAAVHNHRKYQSEPSSLLKDAEDLLISTEGDELPTVGFMSPSAAGGALYVAAANSNSVTLGPFIGALVACEIAENATCELLKSFRPQTKM